MAKQDDRWIEVSKSAFAHETAGLELLRGLMPNASPYRAWTNFEFMDNHGQWHEVDALVLGRRPHDHPAAAPRREARHRPRWQRAADLPPQRVWPDRRLTQRDPAQARCVTGFQAGRLLS